jgi:hypothetical protein
MGGHTNYGITHGGCSPKKNEFTVKPIQRLVKNKITKKIITRFFENKL